MKKMDFFDADILIGRAIDQDEDAAPTIQDVLAELDRTGVSQALVTTTRIIHSNVDWGNDELFQLVKNHPRLRPLYGTWGVVDRPGDDMPSSVDKAIKRGAAGLQLWIREFALAFAPWQFPELLEAASERRLPLFLHADQAEFAGIHDVLTHYPGLRLVLQRVSYGETRKIIALMKAHPGLHLCISPGFVGGSVLEQFEKYLGVDRLLFGSGLFKFDQAPTVAQVTYSTLSDAKKEAIASKNLLRLLGEIQ